MAEFEPQDDTPTVPQTLLKLINSWFVPWQVGRRRHNKDLYEAASCEETANERLIDDSEGCETSKEDTTDMGQTLQQQQQQPLQQQPSDPIASESETGSVLSSPGGRPTPVNFDFHRPDAKRDPHIVQVN